MQPADRFDLCGQGILAQKPALLRQRDPEFPDIAEALAVDWIYGDPKRPLAVRRLFPGVYLRHKNLLLATTHHLYKTSLSLSSRGYGFSPQLTMPTAGALLRPARQRPFAVNSHECQCHCGLERAMHSALELSVVLARATPCAPSSFSSLRSCRACR